MRIDDTAAAVCLPATQVSLTAEECRRFIPGEGRCEHYHRGVIPILRAAIGTDETYHRCSRPYGHGGRHVYITALTGNKHPNSPIAAWPCELQARWEIVEP